MTHLGSLRFGSVWADGVSVGQLSLPYLPERKVSFNEGDWRLISAEAAGLVPLLNLHGTDRRSMLVELKSEDDLKILVPCTEFFVRGYGRSTETIRTLLRFPWKDAKKRFFFDDKDDASRRVKLNHHVKASEAVFLHHALHDGYTTKICERLYAYLQTEFENQKNKKGSLPCLSTGPWFQGSASIEGKGIWIAEKTFLLLDMTGMSEPAGDLIVIERQGTDATGGQAGERVYTRSAQDVPIDQLLDLTDAEPPDTASPIVFYDPAFRRLGEKRRRKTIRAKKPGKRGIALKGEGDRRKLSTGDAHGKGKGIGKGEGIAREHFLQGALAEMWQSCVEMGSKYSESITKVEWFTFADGFVQGGTPGLELLKPHISDESVSAKAKAWTYLSARSGVLRGVLIIRISCGTRAFYIFEIQRRKPLPKSEESSTQSKEESYRGLIAELPGYSTDVENEIRYILKSLCIHVGRIHKKSVSHYAHSNFEHERGSHPIVFEKVLRTELKELGMPLEAKEINAKIAP